MKRLFVALPVDESTKQHLSRLAPKQTGKIRPIQPDNIHLTLQFIGQADPEVVSQSLLAITGPPFALSFIELGKFGTPRNGGALWIGLQSQPQLAALAESIAVQLVKVGIEREPRPFVPHITLARYRGGTRQRALDAFLQQPLPDLPPVEFKEFILYSSQQNRDGSVYRVEQTYALPAAPGISGGA